jgi:predicted Zn-dependent peptidase
MQAIPYERLKETIYFEQLPNGLKVYVLPKEGFQKTYATFTTQYGSIDNHFKVEGGEERQVPDGIAHFLEHKMFEEPDGDVFAKFAAQGASSNAFTSFDRTTYLFSATEQIMKNLETLLNFVQHPYFTTESVEKEKGIIGQEIKMYQDNPNYRAYYGLIEAMYSVHPVHIDIAGTIESIGRITRDTLLDCYHTFYHPSNMILFVVGGIQAEEVMSLVKANQENKKFEKQGNIHRYFPEEPVQVNTPKIETKLSLSLPKCFFGLKEASNQLDGNDLLRRELSTKLMLDILLSPSSAIYQALYDENLITDNFGHEYNSSPGYAFSVIGGDTKSPEALVERVRAEINKVMDKGIDADHFERSRKKKIGNFLRMLNSSEAIADEFAKYAFRNTNLFEILPIYESITLEEVNGRMRDHFDWEQLAISIIKSEVK